MNVAVLTLTRDRLEYTQHCFASLNRNAGCYFDHFVLDQGSTDGTREWLYDHSDAIITQLDENIGICRGLNLLLDTALDTTDYDVIVRFDNDCEVTMPDTLRVTADLARIGETILSPRVNGLRNPPGITGNYLVDGRVIDETTILGGIFMAVPAHLYHRNGYRYDENQPPWIGDELICPWWRSRGGRCGYIQGLSVNHYETTDGQHARYPDYFARKRHEGLPV